MGYESPGVTLNQISELLNIPFVWDVTMGGATDNFKSVAGTWDKNANAVFHSGQALRVTTDTLNDEVCIGNIYIPETDDYTLRIKFTKSSSSGKCHIMLDGVDKGTIDFYNGSTTHNNEDTLALSSLAAGGYTITLKIASKNASSSGYAMSGIQYIIIERS